MRGGGQAAGGENADLPAHVDTYTPAAACDKEPNRPATLITHTLAHSPSVTTRWDEQNALLVDSHERVIRDLTEEAEAKLAVEVLAAQTLRQDKDSLIKEASEVTREGREGCGGGGLCLRCVGCCVNVLESSQCYGCTPAWCLGFLCPRPTPRPECAHSQSLPHSQPRPHYFSRITHQHLNKHIITHTFT